MKSLIERFEEKYIVEPMSGCYIWIGATNPDGYGNFNRLGKYVHAHRMAWIFSEGEIPDGIEVMHHCDNPPCVNRRHLFLGTHLDNMKDRDQKGRNGTVGEKNRHSKLTQNQVLEIRAMAGFHKSIAAQFGISVPVVTNIINGKLWKHLTLIDKQA